LTKRLQTTCPVEIFRFGCGIQKFPAAPEPNPKFAYDSDTYVQVVEFTPKGATAKALVGYGNASRPGSTHITDQVSYYEQKRLRAVYRTRSEVEAHAVRRESY
jgi:acyl-homoserine-lactone acylase